MSIAKEGDPRHVRALGNLRSRQRRMASRRRVNRFTGFIPEPRRGFVSQRICRRTRHTTIQKSGGNAGSQGGHVPRAGLPRRWRGHAPPLASAPKRGDTTPLAVTTRPIAGDRIDQCRRTRRSRATGGHERAAALARDHPDRVRACGAPARVVLRIRHRLLRHAWRCRRLGRVCHGGFRFCRLQGQLEHFSGRAGCLHRARRGRPAASAFQGHLASIFDRAALCLCRYDAFHVAEGRTRHVPDHLRVTAPLRR
ncbi:hypothetical protein CEQ23_24840 [Burkholderia cepacia]|uniref:Uncharacterized protein n=1 Tax=Burkholderia cepacia TaxID=292 RepID=A0ABM6P5T1_BURCE|nr:hypothetical protein CEQ23_24840 [Burkholderia cepacia]ATF82283.1 hypothetical protein CO711_34025 [Burkholderia cepacia]